MIYPELSYAIIGAAMEVHNGLGPGWDEWDYHLALIDALEAKGHRVVSHERMSLIHRGSVVDHFELDLLVDDLIVLELKHIKTDFHPEHFTQTINYLKRWGKRLGILINFGMERLAYTRVPYDTVVGNMHVRGKWDALAERLPSVSERVAGAVTGILETHGYGYGVSVFQKILISELCFLGSVAAQSIVIPSYGKRAFDSRAIDCVSVDSKVLVSVTATGRNASSTDLAYLKSYMKQTNICNGIVIDIGNPDIQLKGVL